uniref:AAA+ ATPase domain-containing protein n=1 Tax=Ananas comosus var. bracteatus TaxID=296719 RepID=A0A6V7QJ15_ANACO|nr:unnamed protein product [Ananas comosus var. bracteatus]
MDVDAKLQHLRCIIIPEMKMLIEAAENSPHRDCLHGWVKSLEEAVREAELVLDQNKCRLLKQKAKSSAGGITMRLKSLPLVKDLSKGFGVLLQNRKLTKRLMKLEKTAVKAKEFLPWLSVGVSNVRGYGVTNVSGWKFTTSLLTHKVFGRDEQRDRIVGFLRDTATLESESSIVKNHSVVAIVGVGGAGKTTLAQYICDYERETKHFDVIMWIHVPQRLDVVKLTKEMVESATLKECPNLTNFDSLQGILEDSLRSKKFLLVLDDVWSATTEVVLWWEQLLAPLSAGNRGSKILITTRAEKAAEFLRARHILRLEEIEQSDFLSLFMYYALGDAKVDNNRLYERLKDIVRQNAPKLHGSPLAARMVGSQLCKRPPNVDFWESILSKDLSEDIASLHCGAIRI